MPLAYQIPIFNESEEDALPLGDAPFLSPNIGRRHPPHLSISPASTDTPQTSVHGAPIPNRRPKESSTWDRERFRSGFSFFLFVFY